MEVKHTQLPTSAYRGGATGGGGGGGRSGFGRTNLNTELKIYIYISFLNPKEVAVYVQYITT